MGRWDWRHYIAAAIAALLLWWTARWVWGLLHPKCDPLTTNVGSPSKLIGLDTTLNGSPLPSLDFHMQLVETAELGFTNNTSGVVAIPEVRLFQNIGKVDQRVDSLPAACRVIKMTRNTCLNDTAPKNLAVGESCEVEIRSQGKVTSGKLELATGGINHTVVFVIHP